MGARGHVQEGMVPAAVKVPAAVSSVHACAREGGPLKWGEIGQTDALHNYNGTMNDYCMSSAVLSNDP